MQEELVNITSIVASIACVYMHYIYKTWDNGIKRVISWHIPLNQKIRGRLLVDTALKTKK